jgi:hypothetical protein
MDGRELCGLGEARSESKPASGDVAPQHLVKARFAKPSLARVQHFHLTLVDIYAENLMAYIGHAGRVDRTQMTATDHGKPHPRVPLDGFWY